MRAGKLRHTVQIQSLTTGSPTQNAGGELDEEWATVFSAKAAINPLRGRELIAAQQVASEVTGTILIRYRADVTSKQRVLFGSRIYDILAPVDVDERHKELLLYVRENINAG